MLLPPGVDHGLRILKYVPLRTVVHLRFPSCRPGGHAATTHGGDRRSQQGPASTQRPRLRIRKLGPCGRVSGRTAGEAGKRVTSCFGCPRRVLDFY